MPQHVNDPTDDHRHVPVEHRPGYRECELCGQRWILRRVLPDGLPSDADIAWLAEGWRPRPK